MLSWPTGDGEMAGRTRAFDWSATPLGPIAGWPQSLKVATRLLLSTRHPMFIWWGPELIQLYNDAYRDTMGPEKHPAALGGPGRDTWAEIWDIIGPQIAQVMSGGPATWHEDQLVPVTRHGDRRQVWWTYSFSPIDDEAAPDGVGGVLVVCRDVTQEHLARAAALESEARYRAFVTASADVVYRMSPDWSVMQQLDGAGFLADTPEPRRGWLKDYIHPDDRAVVQAAVRDAVATRSSFELEHRVRRADGTLGWALSRAVPILGERGEVVEWLGAAGDVTPRKEAEQASRESEARFQALFAASPVPFMVLKPNAPDFTITAANDAYLAATLTTREGLIGRRLFDVFTDDPERPGQLGSDALALSLDRVLASRRTDAMERVRYDIVTPGGGFAPHWWLAINAPMLDATGRIEAIIHQVTRVTELHLAEMAEQEHRARQAFLLELSDALRPLVDANALKRAAARVLGERLGVNRAFYGEVSGDDWVIAADYERGIVPLPPGRYAAGTYGAWMMDTYRRGGVLDFGDSRFDPRFSTPEREALARLEITAALGIGLVKGGRLVAIFAVQSGTPRTWTAADVSLLTETGERTWAAVERARTEEALRESEERFRQFASASSDALWIRDAETLTMEYVSPAIQAIYGVPPEALSGDLERWSALILSEDRGTALAHLEAARAGEAVVHEFRILRPSDAAVRWIRNTDFPLLDEHGRVQRIGGIAEDVTEMKATEAALIQSEARLRGLFESVPQLVWRAADGGDWTWASPQWAGYTGQPESDSRGLGWLKPIHPDDRDRAMTAWDRALQRGGFEVEHRIRRASDGAYRWFQTRATPVRNADDEVIEWLGTSTDVQDLKALQERQDVMVAELQHRTRNLIAVVRGIADDTMEHTGPTEAFRDAYFDRLEALSRVQGLLSRSEAEPVTIGALVRMELDALGAGAAGSRVSVRGPEVFLRPSTVQTLALALHELATNARKYGALSHERGSLAVSWRERDEGGEPRLALDWVETGREQASGRPASVGTGGGYGRELIEQALPHALGARTRYALTAAGVRCSIDLTVRAGRGGIDHDHT